MKLELEGVELIHLMKDLNALTFFFILL